MDPATFKLLVTNFGDFTTDAFATVPNAVCAKSYSRYSSSGSSGVNFLHKGCLLGNYIREANFHILLINPIYTAGFCVGPVFKGVKDFDAAAIEFDFASYSLSYDFVLLPSHCVSGGCSKCA